MESFADFMLNEEDYIRKLEIAYYLQKKKGIFFDNSVVLKTEITKMFLDAKNLNVDKNLVLTACILCCCKKKKDATDINIIKNYAQDGSQYLGTLGFNKKFCKICEEVNRYSGSNPREQESDILELVDNFGGLVMDRPERRGFPIDEALVLTEYRNLKGLDNKYIEGFKEFITKEENIKVPTDGFNTNNDYNGRIAQLIKITNEYTKSGKEVKDLINILRIPELEPILKEILQFHGKTEMQDTTDEIERQKSNLVDFGIGIA